MRVIVEGQKKCSKAEVILPGDKSIAHRALIIGALPEGQYTIRNFPFSLDCMATLHCMENLGVNIEIENKELKVISKGYKNFNKAAGVLDARNSGTTARLISGMLSGLNIEATLIGDESLSKRPMNRIITPLRQMGAAIESDNSLLPLKFLKGTKLKGITYTMPVASAQVKSCVLISGFLAEGSTKVIETIPTRDHTEKMFKYLGADIEVKDNSITIANSPIKSKDIYVPGDISSAAFLIAAALLSDNSEIIVKNVLLNEGRSKYLHVLKDMGANIEFYEDKELNGEKIGTIIARSSTLRAVNIPKELLPSIIDEVPILAVLSAFSTGTTEICGVDELKYKESNRVRAIVDNLKLCGKNAEYVENRILVFGEDNYINKEVEINSFKDHRIAMAFLVLGVRNMKSTIINQWECTEISFPNAVEYFKEFLNIQA